MIQPRQLDGHFEGGARHPPATRFGPTYACREPSNNDQRCRGVVRCMRRLDTDFNYLAWLHRLQRSHCRICQWNEVLEAIAMCPEHDDTKRKTAKVLLVW